MGIEFHRSRHEKREPSVTLIKDDGRLGLPIFPLADIDINRTNHPHDHLTLPEETAIELGLHNNNRLDQIREAVVKLDHNIALVINDDPTTRDPNGMPISIELDIYSDAKNTNKFSTINSDLFQSLNNVFSESQHHYNQKRTIINNSEFSTANLGEYISKFMILSGSSEELPININLLQIPDLDEEIQKLISTQDSNLTIFQIRDKNKLDPNTITPEAKIDLLDRDPKDFFNNLSEIEYRTVSKLLGAANSRFPDIILPSTVILAEGSATTSRDHNDIDLRLLYSSAGKNFEKIENNPDEISQKMLEQIIQVLNEHRIHNSTDESTEYRQNNELTISPELSIKIPIGDTNKFIFLTIQRAPVKYLESIFTNNRDRTDLPVILSRINRVKNVTIPLRSLQSKRSAKIKAHAMGR